MHIFRRAKDPEGDQIKLEYRYSLKYPEDEIDLNYSEVPFKLFNMQTLILSGDDKSFKFF